MAKIKITVYLLLLSACVVAACGEKDDPSPYDPITLSYEPNSFYALDNESKQVKVILDGGEVIYIYGGDGNYTYTNHSPKFIDCGLSRWNGHNLFMIKTVSIGTGSVTIKDGSGHKYKLTVDVVDENAGRSRVYTYPYIITNAMDKKKKAELQQKIINDASTGEWIFYDYDYEKEEMLARRYLTYDPNSEYKEYKYFYNRNTPPSYKMKPFWAPSEIHWWRFIQSDTEEFVLYCCEPFANEEGKWIRGYNYIIDVTDRYIEDYPEIIAAYEVQIGFPQVDFE